MGGTERASRPVRGRRGAGGGEMIGEWGHRMSGTELVNSGDGRVNEEFLALDPERFARDVEISVATLTDHERGLLASALAGALEKDGSAPVVQLGLESADPSLMSRSDVARLLVHLQREDRATLRRALQSLREAPDMQQVVGALFAPSRESSDTGRLGSGA